MLKPTNDPIAVARRRQEEAERVNREALAANGSQSAQGLRKVLAILQQLLDLLLRMPWSDGRQEDTDGWSLTNPGAWVTVASTTIPRPEDKTRVVVSAAAYVTAFTTVSEFGRSAFDTRIVINGVASETNAQDRLIDQLQEELARYRERTDARLDALESENRSYRAFIGVQRDHMAAHGIPLPPWPEGLPR